MKNKFAIGAATGALALVLAVPMAAQFASAQSAGSSASAGAQTQSAAGGFLGHLGLNGVREEVLTGDTAAKVTQAAFAAVPGGTVDRAETDADGAVYEAHMTKADGSRVTVLFDANFEVTEIEEGHGGPKSR